MDLKKAKSTLKKINTLFESLESSGSPIREIEKKLIRDYIADLYEDFLNAEKPKKVTPPDLASRNPLQELKSTRQITELEDQPKTSVKSPPRMEPIRPKVSKSPDAPLEVAPIKKEPAPPKEEPTPIKSFSAPKPSSPKTQTKAVSPSPIPEPKKQKEHKPSEAVDMAWNAEKAKDLAARFGQNQLDDLTKALSINDRLLYMNELFGRDMNNLQSTLSSINQLGSKKEAKQALYQLADQYNWDAPEKADIVKAFVELVKRRFI